MKLYHYTSFDTFVKIWLTKQLKFSSIDNVNDIQEKTISVRGEMNQLPIICLYSILRTSYKQISFTKDYSSTIKGCMSPMMWGLYGDKTYGVCIEVDSDLITFSEETMKGDVIYKDMVPLYDKLTPDIRSINGLRNFFKDNSNTIFFTKQKSWEGENEYRLVSNQDSFLNIEKAITAIYLISSDSLECKLVQKLVGEKVSINVFYYEENLNKAHPKTRTVESYNNIMRQKDRLESHRKQIIKDYHYGCIKDDDDIVTKYDTIKIDE